MEILTASCTINNIERAIETAKGYIRQNGLQFVEAKHLAFQPDYVDQNLGIVCGIGFQLDLAVVVVRKKEDGRYQFNIEVQAADTGTCKKVYEQILRYLNQLGVIVD